MGVAPLDLGTIRGDGRRRRNSVKWAYVRAVSRFALPHPLAVTNSSQNQPASRFVSSTPELERKVRWGLTVGLQKRSKRKAGPRVVIFEEWGELRRPSDGRHSYQPLLSSCPPFYTSRAWCRGDDPDRTCGAARGCHRRRSAHGASMLGRCQIRAVH